MPLPHRRAGVTVQSFGDTWFCATAEVLLDPCLTWCPSSSCQAVCQLKETEVALPQLVQCAVCTLEFCSACKANWHPGQVCPPQENNLPITAFLPGETRYGTGLLPLPSSFQSLPLHLINSLISVETRYRWSWSFSSSSSSVFTISIALSSPSPPQAS